MSTPTKNTVKAITQADLAALQAADNAKFIADADIVIEQQSELGKFFATFTLLDHVVPVYIYDYYSNLGYHVRPASNFTGFHGQPAQLFGTFWIAYWTNSRVGNVKDPIRMTISWKS